MKNKSSWLLRGTFALLLFVFLGYIVKFYPEQLIAIDQAIQAGIRGDLPSALTTFFTIVTTVINTPIITSWVLFLVGLFVYRKWYAEALLLAGNLAVTGLLIVLLKPVYQRPRPFISHLVVEKGYSFPSGHALAATIIFGSLLMIIAQRIQQKRLNYLVSAVFILLILIIMVSRVYLGVHYPTDVLGSALLGTAYLHFLFPYYDLLRFKWRFTGKQR